MSGKRISSSPSFQMRRTLLSNSTMFRPTMPVYTAFPPAMNSAGLYPPTLGWGYSRTSPPLKNGLKELASATCARFRCSPTFGRPIMATAGLRPSNEITNRHGLPGFVWPSILFCRSDLARTPPANWTAFDFENTSYELVSGDPINPYAISCRCKIHGYYAEMNGRALSRPHLMSTEFRNQSIELGLYIYATNVLESSSNLASWTQVSTFAKHQRACSLYRPHHRTLPFLPSPPRARSIAAISDSISHSHLLQPEGAQLESLTCQKRLGSSSSDHLGLRMFS